MKYPRFELFILLALLCAGTVPAQQPPENPPAPPFLQPLPERFEEAVEIAMNESPEVVMAKLKMQQAAAELRQARLEIIRKVTELWQEREKLQRSLSGDTSGLQSGMVNGMKMELENVSASLRCLIGLGVPMEGMEPDQPRLPMMPRPRPPLPEEIRQKLQQPVTLEGEMKLGDALDSIAEQSGMRFIPDFEIPLNESLRGFRADAMPVEQVMHSLTDQMEFLAFVNRDYGLLVTNRERAMRLEGPAIPENLPLFQPEIPMEQPPE